MSDQFPEGFVWSEGEQRPTYSFYTARETAEILGVSERTIRRHIEAGTLRADKHGGEFRIDLDEARTSLAGTRAQRPVSLDTRVEWLERENERLWALLEKSVSR